MPLSIFIKAGLFVVFVTFLANSCSRADELLTYPQSDEIDLSEYVRASYPDIRDKLLLADSGNDVEISLQILSGVNVQYKVEAIDILSSQLAAAMPLTKTYRLKGVNNASTGALDLTSQGVRGLVDYNDQAFFIESESIFIRTATNNNQITSNIRNLLGSNTTQNIHNGGDTVTEIPLRSYYQVDSDEDSRLLTAHQRYFGDEISKFKIAVVSTPRFLDYIGGKENTLAEIITAINRASWIFERDVAIQFELVTGLETLFDTWSRTFPNKNISVSDVIFWLEQDIAQLIESEYDLITAFDFNAQSPKGSGVASFFSACENNTASQIKGSAVQMGGRKKSDFIGVLLHEIGHQFGATHSFEGFCVGVSGRAGYEFDETIFPIGKNSSIERGTGSTLMSYAGFCTDESRSVDTDKHKRLFFNGRSIDQMREYVSGELLELTRDPQYDVGCAKLMPTNREQSVLNAGPNKLVPHSTPLLVDFQNSALDGSVVYSADQYDLSNGDLVDYQNFYIDRGKGALFRSAVSHEPKFFFPSIDQVVSNGLLPTKDGVVPTTERVVSFLITAKSDQGVTQDLLSYTVTKQAGPFTVSTDQSRYRDDDDIKLTWDVANTDTIIGCDALTLSINSGLNKADFVEFAVVENNGAYSFSKQALPERDDYFNVQVMAACASGGFFNISDKFSIFDKEVVVSIPERIEFAGESIDTELVIRVDGLVTTAFSINYRVIFDNNLIEGFGENIIQQGDIATPLQGTLNINEGTQNISIPLSVAENYRNIDQVFGLVFEFENALPNVVFNNTLTKVVVPARIDDPILPGPDPDDKDSTGSSGGSFNLFIIICLIIFGLARYKLL